MIHIYTRNKEILLKFNNAVNFSDSILCLKQHSCRYAPEEKEWIIPISVYEGLIKDLEQYDIVYISNEDEISDILNPMPILKIERTSFSLEDLKSLPIIGKSPYENYQIEDIQKSLNRSRYGLFLDTGTGKSFIILSAINILRKRNKLNKILYITSNSGVYDIKEKFLQFTDIPEDRIQIGNKHNRKPFSIDCDVIICNYRSFLLISDEYQKSKNRGKNTTKNYRSSPIPIKQWLNGDKGCCVLDESHNIAIPQSRQTKAIHLIREYFYYRYVLTGTPADKEEKYYSQLKFLDTSLVRNFDYYDWLEYYANLGNRFSQYAIDSFKPKKLQELQEIVKNNCSRRLAEDVLLLPPNLIKKLYVEMNPIQKTIYEEFVKEQVKLKKQSITGRDFKNLFPKLLMAVDNPERIDLDGINNTIIAKALQKFKFKSHHPKIEILEDILLDHEGKKIIIWTSHPHVGFNLQELLKKYNPFIINGEVPVPKEYKTKEEYKNAIVKEFRLSKNRNILIAGTQVLNTAVTITECNVQIYFDMDYNYTNTKQSEARIYRLGQKEKVYTYILLIKHSLDVTRYNLMQDKDFLNKKFTSDDYINSKLFQELLLGG